MRKAVLAVFIVFLAAAPGFAGRGDAAKERFVAAEAVIGEKLAPRPAPARLSQESEDDLIKKGFVRIGEISLDEITGTFWGQEKPPQNFPSPDLTAPLLRGAADHGGDLVVLSRSNALDSYQVTKKGKVLTWARQSRVEYYQQRTGTGDAGVQASRTVYYNAPATWEMITGMEFAVRSTGTVWRQDQELARRVSTQTEAERQARLQKEKAVDEIDRQALLLLEGAERQAGADRQATELHEAVRDNDVEKVQALLAQGLDVNRPGPDGRTAMHVAASAGAAEAALALLAKGADVNAKGPDGGAPLHLAVKAKALFIVELLLANGANVNAKTDEARTPLHVAVLRNALEMADLLLSKGADPNAKDVMGVTPLAMAEMLEFSAMADRLRAKGAR